MKGNQRSWKHGTEYAYRMKGCRCPECTSARTRRTTVVRMAKRGRTIEDEQGGRVHVDLPYKPGPLSRVLRALNGRLATLEADLAAALRERDIARAAQVEADEENWRNREALAEQREKVRSISNLYANERDDAAELRLRLALHEGPAWEGWEYRLAGFMQAGPDVGRFVRVGFSTSDGRVPWWSGWADGTRSGGFHRCPTVTAAKEAAEAWLAAATYSPPEVPDAR